MTVGTKNRIGRRFAAIRCGIATGIIASSSAFATGAPCQEGSVDERSMAEALFRVARELMQEGRHAEACRKFEESQRLVRAAGTLINLAVCHEKEGKLATAWFEYQESIGVAIRMNRTDREEVARERMAAIEPLIPHLRIDVPPDARIEGLRIERGETEIPEVSWGLPVPVDPGSYSLRATAPGHEPWSSQVSLQQGEDELVTVPRLSRIRPREPEATPIEAPKRPIGHRPTVPVDPGGPDEGGSGSGLRTTGWIGGGVGIAMLAAGGYYGVRALQKRSESDDYCTSRGCYVEGVELNNQARELAVRSNVLLGVGAVLVGAGAVVLTTAPASRESQAEGTPRVDVAIAPTGVNAAFRVGW